MKKIENSLTAALAAFLLAFTITTPAHAADAYNGDATPRADKSAFYLIGDDAANQNFSTLTAYGPRRDDGSSLAWTCDSVSDSECAASKAKDISSTAILPICTNGRSENCVVSLQVTNKDGVLEEAKYLRNTGGMNFSASAKHNYYGATTPALFDAPNSPSASGTTGYMVTVRTRLWLHWPEGKFDIESLNAEVVPYREQTGNFKAPQQMTAENNHRGERGVGIDGNNDLCAWNEAGMCGIRQDFAEGQRIKLVVRMSSEIGGWFKGRIKNPNISVKKYSTKNNEISVEAEPAKVQRLLYQTSLDKLTKTETDYAMDNGMGGGWESGFTSWATAENSKTFGYLEYFRKLVSDTASGTNTYWNYSTTKSHGDNRCLDDTSKVLGIVSTNAMVYDGGVPRFSGGFLSYKVAGLHYAPGGEELNLGAYDMVMRSETARCLYGFSKAPLSATVSVVNDKGGRTVATTVVKETKDGWLKMAAYGFTFSKKTIKVKITKKKK